MKKTCCFAGHREIFNIETIEDNLKAQIIKLISDNGIKEFLVGNYGGFDKLVQRKLMEVKIKFPDIKVFLVIPYLTESIKTQDTTGYECIVVADMPENIPRKYQILKCNEYMVNKCDYIICYVKNTWGGAYKTLEYAKKKGLEIYNL